MTNFSEPSPNEAGPLVENMTPLNKFSSLFNRKPPETMYEDKKGDVKKYTGTRARRLPIEFFFFF
jgi:hypothetical protein